MPDRPLIIEVRVKPRSRTRSLARGEDGIWLAALKAPPVEGRANRELVALVAREFGCAASRVTIKAGRGGRTKLVAIAPA